MQATVELVTRKMKQMASDGARQEACLFANIETLQAQKGQLEMHTDKVFEEMAQLRKTIQELEDEKRHPRQETPTSQN